MSAGSLHNLLADRANVDSPFQVGDGATLVYWTDRQACTVISVSKSGKSMVIQNDTATRSDSNGMSDAQSYEYAPNPNGSTHSVRLTKRGWRVGGQRGQAVVPGRRHYHDFSF